MVGNNTLTYTDTDLSANTIYHYQISAVNRAGEGQKSSEISATTLVSNSTNSTNNSKNISIGGMDIESIILVSSVGIIITIIDVKKRMK